MHFRCMPWSLETHDHLIMLLMLFLICFICIEFSACLFLWLYSLNDAPCISVHLWLFCVCLSTETVARNIEGTEIVSKECIKRVCRILEVMWTVILVMLFIWLNLPVYTRVVNAVGKCLTNFSINVISTVDHFICVSSCFSSSVTGHSHYVRYSTAPYVTDFRHFNTKLWTLPID